MQAHRCIRKLWACRWRGRTTIASWTSSQEPITSAYGPWKMAAQSCFGQDEWPASIPEPTASIDFDLADAAAVQSAVQEMKAQGQGFIHEAKTEPWGQTVARFMSPEGVLVTLSYAPWLHEQEA